MHKVLVYDPTSSDKLSAVRGVGRYLQILKESFPEWVFTDKLQVANTKLQDVFINPFFNFLYSPLILKRIAKKQIAIIHDVIPLKYPGHFPIGIKGNFNVFLNKLVLRNYDHIVTDSKASKKDLVKVLGVPENKIKIVYPCLPAVFNSKLNSKFLIPDSKFCVYVGDVSWNKNLVNIAKAIKKADVPCAFVGKAFTNAPLSHPWQKEYEEFSKEAEGDEKFLFPGFVNDKELIYLYKNSLLNILVSKDEGFGFSYLEASKVGCPSVLSNIPVLRETAVDTALFANPNDVDEIAEKIKQLASDKKLRDGLSKKANERSKFFSKDNFREGFMKVIGD